MSRLLHACQDRQPTVRRWERQAAQASAAHAGGLLSAAAAAKEPKRWPCWAKVARARRDLVGSSSVAVRTEFTVYESYHERVKNFIVLAL